LTYVVTYVPHLLAAGFLLLLCQLELSYGIPLDTGEVLGHALVGWD